MLFDTQLGNREARYAKWLGAQTDEALITASKSLSGDVLNDVKGELTRRGIKA